MTIWNVAATGVYLFALCVALSLASGELDPMSFAYYGVAANWRMPVLLTLVVALQVLWIGDAIVLGLRLRSVPMWAMLVLAAIVGPFAMVVVWGGLTPGATPSVQGGESRHWNRDGAVRGGHLLTPAVGIPPHRRSLEMTAGGGVRRGAAHCTGRRR